MNYKLVIVAGVGVLVVAAFGFFFSGFALTNSYFLLIIAAALGILYLSLFTLRMILIKEKWLSLFLITLDLILFTTSFVNHLSLWLFISVLIATLWLYGAWRLGRNSIKNMVELHLRDLRYGFMKSSFRAIVFLMVAAYLSLINPSTVTVPRDIFSSIVKTMTKNSAVPIIQEITGQPYDAETGAAVIERAGDMLYAAANRLISIIPENVRSIFLVGFGLIVFLLVSTTTGFFAGIASFVAWLFIKLLLRINFISIKHEQIDKEVIITV